MEFYVLGFSAVSAMADGFNSQRDGILLGEKIDWVRSSSFNSQRDGILPLRRDLGSRT